ncbi:MAG: fused MFS/spermidine synthase [Armatimonadota bacterium]
MIFLLFFLSGFTSLIYEVIWVRKFGLVFGVTTYAVSTVLAAFFAGLAIGSYGAGRLVDRARLHPLRLYGVMEGLIGVYALLLPVLLGLVERSYPAVYGRVGESFTLFTLYRFLISFAVLVIPTIMMGATLPVLSKFMVDREEVLGLNVGRLYAVNTFGAVAGTFCAGFILIPALGVPNTTLAAANGNFLLVLVALAISLAPELRGVEGGSEAASAWSRVVKPREEGEAPAAAPPLAASDKAVLALAFTSGLCVLALEVVWTRSLVLILGSTTYAFSTMLVAVLVGIAAGSAVFAPLADRTQNRGAMVAFLMFFGGLFAALGPAIINRLPFLFLQLSDWAYGQWSLVIAAQFAVCFVLVFVPTFLSGASFPILVRMYSRGEQSVGRTVADIYAMNTFGGILGSLLGGFVLVKLLGLQPSLTVAALALMAVGGPVAMALARPWGRGERTAGALAMAAVVVALVFVHPRFDTKLLFAGWGPFAGGYYVSRMGGTTVDVTDRHMQRLLYHKEGVSASVDVLETAWGDRIISVNAQPVATTYLYDMRALKMLGHLPVLLHPDPKEVLLIGMGAGVSTGTIAAYPGVEDVTVVELSEEVPGGTRKFADVNFDALDNPKVKVVINDGANYVKATEKQYDIISSDPIHPFIAGNGILYSVDHWLACKERLKEGGVLAQWLPLYQLSPTDFATIIGSFADAFPNCTMWFCGIDTVLIGTKGPLKVDVERMASHMSDPTVMADLISMGVHEPADVLGWYVCGPEEMKAMGMGAPRNRVERPVLEFTAPKSTTLTGVASTVPALLTAIEQLPAHSYRRHLTQLTTRPLSAQEILTAASQRIANRWLMREQLLISYNYADQSLEATLQALALRPNDTFIRRAVSDAQYAVADQRMSDGYPEEAFEYYRGALANDPGNLMALTGAVTACLHRGDLATAEGLMQMASAGQREAFQYLIYEGLLAVRRGDYGAARKAFEKAASHRQESPMMHAYLGLLDLREGQRPSASAHFERAVQIATTPMDALSDIVDLCASDGFAIEARPYAERLVEVTTAGIASDPGLPSLYSTRALAYSALGEQSLAERDMDSSRALLGWWEGVGERSAGDAPPAR